MLIVELTRSVIHQILTLTRLSSVDLILIKLNSLAFPRILLSVRVILIVIDREALAWKAVI